MRKRLLACAAAASALVAAVLIPSNAAGASWWPAPKPPSVTCAGPTVYKADGTPWKCTFDDEFSGSVLDSSKWKVMTSTTGAPLNTMACFVSNANNVSVSGGYLNLTARKEPAPFSCPLPGGLSASTQYTAGEVSTYGKFSQTYGRFAVRASFPAATVEGLQSALWMYPNTTVYGAWPASGEIDIAEEYSGFADRAIPTLHYNFDSSTVNTTTDVNVVTNNNCLISNVNAFHDYVMEWTTTTITISYDGQVCLVDHPQATGLSGIAPFDQPFFMVLTQALGIGLNGFNPASTPLPATTRVDYVRMWK
jgi:beta-glucanase (GH16 family)